MLIMAALSLCISCFLYFNAMGLRNLFIFITDLVTYSIRTV